ncbi:unnamed protein product [Closterium sp. NIES-54]
MATAETAVASGLPPQWQRWFDSRLAALHAHSLLRRLRPIDLLRAPLPSPPAPIPLGASQSSGESAEAIARSGEWGFGAREGGDGGRAQAGEEADEDSIEAPWWDVAAVEVLISEEAFQRWLDEPAGDGGQLFPLPSIQSHGTPDLPPSAISATSKPSPSSNSASSPSPSPHPSPSLCPSPYLHPPSAGGNPRASPRRLVLFSANDYLGLASHPRVRAAAAKVRKLLSFPPHSPQAAWQQGMGPRASALVTGYTTEHEGLEHDIAWLKGTQACLLCPTGFAANLAVLASLAPVAHSKGNDSSDSRNGSDSNDWRENAATVAAESASCSETSSNSSSSNNRFRGSGGGISVGHGQRRTERVDEVRKRVEEGRVEEVHSVGDSLAVFSDELNHASIIDALRLLLPRTERGGAGVHREGRAAGGATAVSLHVYRHNDMTHLDELLTASPASRKLVVSDSLFSMDGDFAPLPALAALKAKHGFLLVLDEAHATLVCGSKGGGAAEEMGVKAAVDVHVGTLSKAVGCLGGYIACSAPLRDFFASRGRSFIFSTALPVPVVAAARAALAVAAEERWRQRAVWQRVKQLGVGLGVTFTSPICPIVLGSADLALQASRHLLLSGFHVPAIRPPTVAPGSSR